MYIHYRAAAASIHPTWGEILRFKTAHPNCKCPPVFLLPSASQALFRLTHIQTCARAVASLSISKGGGGSSHRIHTPSVPVCGQELRLLVSVHAKSLVVGKPDLFGGKIDLSVLPGPCMDVWVDLLEVCHHVWKCTWQPVIQPFFPGCLKKCLDTAMAFLTPGNTYKNTYTVAWRCSPNRRDWWASNAASFGRVFERWRNGRFVS